MGEVRPQVAHHPEFGNNVQVLRDGDCYTPNASRTTSVLIVYGSVRSFTLLQLRESFPAVVDLSIMPAMYDGHLVPYRLVFSLWPNLRTLAVTGWTSDQLPNCEAAFSGINEEEEELLWSMDEEC